MREPSQRPAGRLVANETSKKVLKAVVEKAKDAAEAIFGTYIAPPILPVGDAGSCRAKLGLCTEAFGFATTVQPATVAKPFNGSTTVSPKVGEEIEEAPKIAENAAGEMAPAAVHEHETVVA